MSKIECTCTKLTYKYDPYCKLHGSLAFRDFSIPISEKINNGKECTCKRHKSNYDSWCEIHGTLFHNKSAMTFIKFNEDGTFSRGS